MNNGIIFSMGTHTYVAKFEEDKEDGGYVVTFPSLRGCITYGKTLEEAIRMAQDALELCITCLIDEGQSLPKEKISLLKKVSRMNIPLSVTV